MVNSFAAALEQRLLAGQAPAVVGLDPRVGALPSDVEPHGEAPARITAFYREVLPLLAPHIPVVKPNIAFFEQFGWEGFRAYQETCRCAQEAGMLVIGDIKRGDIGSTAQAYAAGHFKWADAVTLHPYLGSDSLEPFLVACREAGKGVFILVRTSNPSAREFQELAVSGTDLQGQSLVGADLSVAVARAVHRWGEGTGVPGGFANVGAVVGATSGAAVGRLRELMPRAWLLLPGVGAQGASVEDVRCAFDARGRGGLVSQSRGVMHCFSPGDTDWREQIERAAAAFAIEVHRVAGTGIDPS